MSVFDVDFSAAGLPNYMTPVRLREAIRLAWLQALLGSVKYTYGLFMGNRTNDLYVLNHSSQVCYIEAALNDVFDNTLRRIYIADGPFHDPVYLYRRNEDKPVYMARRSEIGTTAYPSPQYLFTRVETAVLGVQFIVMVPTAVALGSLYDVNRLRAIVDKYRLVSKNYYTIQIF